MIRSCARIDGGENINGMRCKGQVKMETSPSKINQLRDNLKRHGVSCNRAAPQLTRQGVLDSALPNDI
jgi:hypothetical protein